MTTYTETLYYPSTSNATLTHFFDRCAGPVMAQLSVSAKSLYPKLTDKWAVLVPAKLGYKLDYSWRKDWVDIKKLYSGISTAIFSIGDFCHAKAGWIPEQAKGVASVGFFKPHMTNQPVVIDVHKMEAMRSDGTLGELHYQTYKNLIKYTGTVVKFELSKETTMCAFQTEKGLTTIHAFPTELLIRMPESYKQFTLKQSPIVNKHINKPKYEIGQIIRGNSSAKEKVLLGLVGVIVDVITIESSFNGSPSFEYVIDFETLPNISLALTVGADASYKTMQTMREWDIDLYNTETCFCPHLMAYEAREARDSVWVTSLQREGVADPKASPLTHEDSIVFKVEVGEKSYRIPHHLLDYIYDAKKLKGALKMMEWVTVSEEEMDGDTYLFLYGGITFQQDVVSLRMRLGRLTTREALLAKYKSFGDKFTNPWQVHRYLDKKSLGHFFTVLSAEDYFETQVPDFSIIEDE